MTLSRLLLRLLCLLNDKTEYWIRIKLFLFQIGFAAAIRRLSAAKERRGLGEKTRRKIELEIASLRA